jgi:hypothetical protein
VLAEEYNLIQIRFRGQSVSSVAALSKTPDLGHNAATDL